MATKGYVKGKNKALAGAQLRYKKTAVEQLENEAAQEKADPQEETTVLSGLTALAPDPTGPLTKEQAGEAHIDGRPRHDGLLPGSPEAKEADSFEKANKSGEPQVDEGLMMRCPDPRYKRYVSDHLSHPQRTSRLWEWWNQLPARFQRLITAYVYRTYPPLIDPEEGSKDYKYIDVVITPFKTDADFNDRYGAGDFKVYLNLTGEKPTRTLAEAHIKGNRDFKSQPPADRRITELTERGTPKWIDSNDPQCKPYIEFLRSRGVMPELWQEKRNQDMQEQASITNQALGMVRELVDKTVNNSNKQNERPQIPIEDTVGKIIDTAMTGARASQEMLRDTIKTLQENVGHNQSQGAADMMNVALQIATVISKQSDPAPYMAIIEKLNSTVAGLQMERLNDKIEALRATQNPTPAQAASQNLSQLIEEFRKIQSLVGGDDDRGPRMPWWAAMAQSMAAPAAQIVTQLTTAFMASRMPAGMPMPGMGAMPMPQAQPQPAPGFGPGFQPPTGPPPAGPAPEAFLQPQMQMPAGPPSRDPRFGYPDQPQQAQPQPAGPDPLLVMLVGIQAPLLSMFREGAGGDDFADWFIGGYKEEIYNELMERADQIAGQMGTPRHAAILMLLDSYPPLAQELNKESRSDVERFAKEFASFDGEAFDRKKERERERDEREARGEAQAG